ncbi:MAG TPA: MipA/OmpV family protein [Holophagaceae bacterium]|nr:MipA/OmpV family protein [Holophagaceae bacterium]
MVLNAQDPDSLWLKPSAYPGLTLHSGAMVLNLPAYPGSDHQRSQPFPILNGEWRDKIGFGASRFGVGGSVSYHFLKEDGYTGSLGLEGVEARREEMADELAGMGNRPATVYASAGLAWRKGPLEVMAGFRRGFREGVGGGGVVRAAFTVPLGRRWLLEARVAGSAYDITEMIYEYGITEEQAARRHQLVLQGDPRLKPGDDRPFTPTGGWALIQSSVAVGYAVSEHWRLGITFLQQEVQGEARRSPLVMRPRSQGTVIGFSYQL